MGVAARAGYSFGTNGHAQRAGKPWRIAACLVVHSINSMQQRIGVLSNGH